MDSVKDPNARWNWSAERLTAFVNARLSPSERLRLDWNASRSGLTVSEVTRVAILEYLAIHERLAAEAKRA